MKRSELHNFSYFSLKVMYQRRQLPNSNTKCFDDTFNLKQDMACARKRGNWASDDLKRATKEVQLGRQALSQRSIHEVCKYHT